ncbi:MAG: hypothetical protein IJS90_10110 [Clostridia bacterium]|nr:hypothetical protein [Clostridia bacterium]
MKTYLEVAEDVFRKGDDYLKQREQKRSRFKKGAAVGVLAVLCIAVFGLLQQLPNTNVPTLTPVPSDNTHTEETISTRSVNETVSDLSETNPSQTTTNPDQNDYEPATTPIIERDTTNPPETNPEPVTQKADDLTDPPTSTEAEPTTLSGAPSYSGSKRLKAAIEDNVCGWIRYNGTYYLQDGWSNGNTIDLCEPIGSSYAEEGNLEQLGLTGEVFFVADDDNYAGCLLLKTDSGRNIVFIPVPESD